MSQKSIDPVARYRITIDTTEMWIALIGMIEAVKFTVCEWLGLAGMNELGIPCAKFALIGMEGTTIESAMIYPFREFRHGGVIKDAGSAVVAGEPFTADGGLTDFLAMIEHDWSTTDGEEHGGGRAPDFHPEPAPGMRVGQANFIMVFGVAEATMESRTGKGHGVDVVGPFAFVVNRFENIVERIVVDRVETDPEKFVEHVGFGEFLWIVVVCFGGEECMRIAIAAATDDPFPEFDWHHVCHVDAEAIDADFLPMGEDFVHGSPRAGHEIGRAFGTGKMAGIATAGKVVAVIEFNRLIPIVDRWRPGDRVITGDAAVGCFVREFAGASGLTGRRQTKRWSAAGVSGMEVVKVVVACEKNRWVVAIAKGKLRTYV